MGSMISDIIEKMDEIDKEIRKELKDMIDGDKRTLINARKIMQDAITLLLAYR